MNKLFLIGTILTSVLLTGLRCDTEKPKYTIPALNMITDMCNTRLNEVCKGFR